MRHRGWSILIKLAIVVTTLVLAWRLLREIGWSELWQRMESAQSGPLILACILLSTRGALLYLRWTQCLALLRQPFSRSHGLTAHHAAILVNHLTPTARLLGGVMRARYCSRRNPVTFADAYGTVLLDQTSHQIVQGLLTWLALAGLVWVTGPRQVAVGLLVTLAALVVAAILWLGNHRTLMDSPPARWLRQAVERRAARLGPLMTSTRRVADIFRHGFTNPRLQLRLAVLGIAVLSVSACSQWLVFRSLDFEAGFLQVFVVVTVGVAAGIVTGTPGGVATTEAAMIASYVALGIPEVEATAATLLFRALHYLVVLTLGVPALLYCESSRSKPVTAPNQLAAEDDPGGETLAGRSPPDSDG